MKKLIIAACCLLGAVTFANAQEVQEERSPLLTKNGYRYLPVAGDISLGIDATPFFQYLGNSFNGSFNNSAPLFNGVDNKIYAKYFLDANTAIRAKLRFNFYGDKHKQTVADDYQRATNPLNVNATTVDVLRERKQDIELSLGYEMRRGHGRVQGFYGGEFNIGYLGGNDLYEYGNEMTTLNQNPTTTTNFFTNPATVANAANRTLERAYGKSLTLGLGGFVGVEYFFAPQISVGGELGLGFRYAIKGQDEITAHQFNTATNAVEEYSYRERRAIDEAFFSGIQTNVTGSIFLMFHF